MDLMTHMTHRLECRMKHRGVNKLKDTVMKLLRGEAASCIYIWRYCLKIEKEEEKHRIQATAMSHRIMARTLAAGFIED